MNKQLISICVQFAILTYLDMESEPEIFFSSFHGSGINNPECQYRAITFGNYISPCFIHY